MSTPAGIINPVISPNLGTGEGAQIFALLLAKILASLFIVGALMLIIMIIWTGYDWITAGGDPQKVEAAQKRLTYALIGFVILVSLRAILSFLGIILGVPFLETLKITWPLAS